MNFFVIFLFIVTGCASVALQRVEIREDYLEDKENARKSVSHDVRERNSQGQYIQLKDVHASDQNVASSSNRTETYEKTPHASILNPTTEGKTSVQKVYFRTRAMDNTRSFLRHFHRHIPEQRSSMEVKRSSTEASDAIRRAETYFAIKTRRLFRAKRSADRDAKRRKFAPFQIFENILEIRRNIPMKLMKVVFAANDAENLWLDGLASPIGAPAALFDQYRVAKDLERQAVKAEVLDNPNKAEDIIKSYKTMIRDGAYDDYLYDHFKIRERHAAFFDMPSKALKKYNDVKRQEYETLDQFLQGSSKSNAPANFEGGSPVKPLNKVAARIENQAAVKPAHNIRAKVKSHTAVKTVQHSHRVPTEFSETVEKPAEKHDSKHASKHASKKARAKQTGKQAKPEDKPEAKPEAKPEDTPEAKSSELGSKAPQTQAQVFLIFLCMVVAYAAAGDLQHVEIGEANI